MKLYEAIETIVYEFGKEIFTNAKVINVFSDYNAFEESGTFKVILKNLITEGYMDQMMYVRDWNSSQDRIINNFIAATGFNEANASYVIKSLAYGFGYSKTIPTFQPSPSGQQPPQSRGATPRKTPAPQQSRNAGSSKGANLDKTENQFFNLDETARRKYKTAAESYLESIIEFKSDFEKELGVKINTYVEYDGFNAIIKFEIVGKIKVRYDGSINFCILCYDNSDRIIHNRTIYVGMKHSSFEVVEDYVNSSQYHKICNIKRIVVYYEID